MNKNKAVRDRNSQFNKLYCVCGSPSRILRFCDRWIYRKIKQTPQFSQELVNFHNCCRFSADFGLRRVPWRHRNVHSVKERLFLNLKNGMNSCVFSCPIYKSYIGQTNRKRNEYALLVWAMWRRPLVCSGRSRLLITRHRYTQRWEIQWRKKLNSPQNQ